MVEGIPYLKTKKDLKGWVRVWQVEGKKEDKKDDKNPAEKKLRELKIEDVPGLCRRC
jgi:hypothetical protein